MSDPPVPVDAPLPPAEARRRYLLFAAFRVAGIAVMAGGVWLGRSVGEAFGLVVVLLGGCAMLVRPRHLGLSRPGQRR